MSEIHPAAPWSTALKITSAISTILLPLFTNFAYRSIPTQHGFTHSFGLMIASVLPAVLVGGLLFVVIGFTFDGPVLLIRRLFWSTNVHLRGLKKAEYDPAACKGSIRIFGNGGLYSFTGLFRNKKLGRYRLFATDTSKAVVLTFDDRKVVVTPRSPRKFLEGLRIVVPSAEIAIPES